MENFELEESTERAIRAVDLYVFWVSLDWTVLHATIFTPCYSLATVHM